METSTTIRQMIAGNRTFVPAYQRAYSWDTELENEKAQKKVNTFLANLEEYNQSTTQSKYYFGNFLFEEKRDHLFAIIDGQQRLTTIIIFLSALFSRLLQISPLKMIEQEIFEDIIKRHSTYRVSTVEYDNQLFQDYVIDQSKKDKNGLKTISARRIISAFDFFVSRLEDKDESDLSKMLDTIQKASCTTYTAKDESEAIRMFRIKNNKIYN